MFRFNLQQILRCEEEPGEEDLRDLDPFVTGPSCSSNNSEHINRSLIKNHGNDNKNVNYEAANLKRTLQLTSFAPFTLPSAKLMKHPLAAVPQNGLSGVPC